MYGGGNFAPPQRGQTSEMSISTSQKLVPPLQPNNLAQQSSLMEKGPPSYPPPLVGQAYHHAYTNDHRGPAPLTGILSSSQSYLAPHSFPPPPPLPQVHLTPMARPFSNPQQDSQWTQNVQQLPPPFPPTFIRPLSTQNGTEILLPPPPPRLQPPLLSQGQPYYRGSVLPPRPASVHGIHQTPLAQPPQSNPTPYPHGHFGSVPRPISQDPQRSSTGLLPPPLPPSSPPGPIPLPPPSPPPTSLSAHSGSTGAELLNSSCVAKISTTNNDSFRDHGMETHLEVDSLVQHPSSSKDTMKNDLPPPPAKPGKERVARKIEVLCQYIARNGPEFEEMTRKNEFGNPEFQFLFGGSPGSEAAAAHEYFLWMKKKCSLSCRVDEGTHRSNLSLRPIEHDALQGKVQASDSSAISVLRESHSPADSNMDIEDEMTEYDDKQKCSESVNDKSDLMSIKHEPQFLAKDAAGEDSIPQHTLCVDASDLAEHKQDLKQANASNAAGGVDFQSVSAERVTGTSAFKLLQSYASDDNSESDREHCFKDISPALVNSSGKSVTATLDGRDGSNFVIDRTTKYSSGFENCCGPSSEHAVALAASIPSKSLDSSKELEGASREVDTTLTLKDKIHDNKSRVNHEYLNSGNRDKAQKENGKYDSTAQLKVDEFGRLVKKGGSDSDSDDLRISRRHGKRDRSRSRSRSRDRSPRRRRQKRSRSHSWSPNKRRSRSRSPFRRRSQYSSDRIRRDKDPHPACFDYKRGKCYRGASCRYSHSETAKGDPSRCHRSKYQTVPPSPKKTGKLMHEHDEVKSQDMQLCQDLVGSSIGASKDCNMYQKENVMSARHIFDKDVDLLISSVAESVRARDAAQIEETQHTRKDLGESPVHNPDDNICKEVNETPQVVDDYAVTHLAYVGAEVNCLHQVLHNAAHQPQHMDVPYGDSQTLPASETKSNPLSISELHPDTKLDRPYPATGSASMSNSSETILTQHLKSMEPSPKYADQPLQSFSSPPSSLQATQIPLQMPSDCRMFPQISKFQCHSTPSGSLIPHQTAFPNQLSSFSSSLNSAWNPLPPPPPRLRYVNDSKVHVSSYDSPSPQLQENQLPLRNDQPPQVLVGPYPTNMHTHSQVAKSHHLTQDPHRPSAHVEDNKSTAMPHVSTMNQQVEGPSAVGEDCLRSLSSHGSLSQGIMHPQPVDMPSGFPVSRMQSFGSNNMHSSELLSSSSQRQSHLQQPSNAMQHSTVHVPDFAGSRIPSYYNPYSTTFEQPSSSNVGADVFCHAKGMSYSNNHGDPFSFSQVSADGRIVDSHDSKNATCSNSNQAFEKILPKSNGDQYDPLFDSIEPPSKSFRTSSNGENREKTADSDMILRPGNSYKPLDLAENTKQRESEAVAVTLYQDNDEYGETAEAEVGAVENGSLSDPIDEPDTAAGEIETDEVKTSGKGNKGKDSRSMKLFKAALADFVKEVLKPSWRQGNMSKEAFKTIVKKTVDKVSGAMKNHQVPKSQTKINHYIDSSQRKLTKLVMGYVDKYVKV